MSSTTVAMDTQAKCESIFRCYVRLRHAGFDHDAAIDDIMTNLGISRDAIRVAFLRACRHTS